MAKSIRPLAVVIAFNLYTDDICSQVWLVLNSTIGTKRKWVIRCSFTNCSSFMREPINLLTTIRFYPELLRMTPLYRQLLHNRLLVMSYI